jgi:subtilisin family serine protease
MPVQQFILLPREGLRAASESSRQVFMNLPFTSNTDSPVAAELPTAPGGLLHILDTIERGGPQLVEMQTELAEAVNAQAGPIRLLGISEYDIPEPVEASDPPTPLRPPTGTALTPFVIQCAETGSARALAGVRVRAVGAGVEDVQTTDAAGRASLTLPGSQVEALFARTGPTHWGAYRTNLPISAGTVHRIEIDAVSLPYRDAVAHYYGASQFSSALGVTVGIIDTGVGPHTDLNIAGGINTVIGEQPNQYEDWFGHGTHVAGLVGATPSSPASVRGLAPGISIRCYRVFAQSTRTASNYSIMKAIILAEAHGCDILNLSLGGGPSEPVVADAIRDAREHGMLVVVAAGNNNRGQVAYPAAYPGATAVSALGAIGCFPPGSSCESEDLRPPNGVAQNEFIARFSNVGAQIAVTAPGVGVVSTLPHNRYGPYSGTSMAAPVVVGATACLLSHNPYIYRLPRDRARSDALEQLLYKACVRRGFGAHFEGYGLPDPAAVGTWPATS